MKKWMSKIIIFSIVIGLFSWVKQSDRVYAAKAEYYFVNSMVNTTTSLAVLYKNNKIYLDEFYGKKAGTLSKLESKKITKLPKRNWKVSAKCKVMVWSDSEKWDTYSLKRYVKTFGRKITGPVLCIKISNGKVLWIKSFC